MQLCIGIKSSKQHIVISMLSEPLEMHILASILWTSRVFFKLCCQELVHIAQNRRNRDSPAINSWPLRPFHSHFPSVPSPSLHRLPSIRKLFFEKSRRVKTQFCKVNGNSNGSPRFLFYTIEDLAEICRTCKRKRSKALTRRGPVASVLRLFPFD